MINTVPTGSHGRLMDDLRRASEAAGFETMLAVGRGADGHDRAVPIGTRRDVRLHGLLTRAFDAHGRGSRRATEAFVDALRLFRPDLLHMHNLHGYYLHIETLFRYIRESRVPTVWTLHDAWALTGHCSHYMRVGCDRWRTCCHGCPQKREYPASLWLDASRRNYQVKRSAYQHQPNLTVVSPAQWLFDALEASILRDARRVLIPNGIDLSLFSPARDETMRARYGVAPGQAMLLAVAAPFDERKGFSDALRIAESVGGRVRLVMVGLTDRQLRGLPAHVTGIRRTDGPEALVALYGEADCLVNPTYEDTYPTVNMEAIACGTPVAAYRVGGCADQIDGTVGAAVTPGDFRALADAAMTLARAKPRVTAACRARAEQYFDRRHAIASYIALYREMTGA